MTRRLYRFPVLLALALAILAGDAQAGPLAERLKERLQQRAQRQEADGADREDLADLGAGGSALSCAEWSRKVERLQSLSQRRNAGPAPDLVDVTYGSGQLEKLDVFMPKRAGREAAPIIMMVHGGGWCVGDKGAASVTGNKIARWVPKGFVFVSVNYPMVADGADALAQAGYVAKAAAFVQANARNWGGDPARLILMGHSAGAHLVSLVNADAELRQANGMRAVLGTVSLDAGAIDVVTQMPRVYPFLRMRYREAFGDAEAGWIAASPFHRLDRKAAPWLGVCSALRKDDPCGQARAYAEKSKGLGLRADVLPERLAHGAINQQLGLPGEYTTQMEAFMAALDPVVARLLTEDRRP